MSFKFTLTFLLVAFFVVGALAAVNEEERRTFKKMALRVSEQCDDEAFDLSKRSFSSKDQNLSHDLPPMDKVDEKGAVSEVPSKTFKEINRLLCKIIQIMAAKLTANDESPKSRKWFNRNERSDTGDGDKSKLGGGGGKQLPSIA